MKTTMSVTIDAEAKELVSKKGLNLSEICNNALWAKANEGRFTSQDLQVADSSLDEVLNSAVDLSKRTSEANQDLVMIGEELRAWIGSDLESEYRKIVEETKGEMPKDGNVFQRKAFWLRVLDKLKERVPAPEKEKGVSP